MHCWLPIYFFGQYIFGTDAEQSPSGTLTQEELDEIADTLPSEFGDDISQGVVPEETSEALSAQENEELFIDPDSYAGKTVSIEGTIYNDPVNNQGILAFNIKTSDQHYAFINYLDLEETVTLNEGDTVEITGVVTGGVQSEAESEGQLLMPLISASVLKSQD